MDAGQDQAAVRPSGTPVYVRGDWEIATSDGEGTLIKHVRTESYNYFRRLQQEAMRSGFTQISMRHPK